MKDLILYTDLPELWDAFMTVITISPLDSMGFMTLALAKDYIADIDTPYTAEEFWKAMRFFLSRFNEDINKKRKLKGKRKEAYGSSGP